MSLRAWLISISLSWREWIIKAGAFTLLIFEAMFNCHTFMPKHSGDTMINAGIKKSYYGRVRIA